MVNVYDLTLDKSSSTPRYSYIPPPPCYYYLSTQSLYQFNYFLTFFGYPQDKLSPSKWHNMEKWLSLTICFSIYGLFRFILNPLASRFQTHYPPDPLTSYGIKKWSLLYISRVYYITKNIGTSPCMIWWFVILGISRVWLVPPIKKPIPGLPCMSLNQCWCLGKHLERLPPPHIYFCMC